MLHKQYATISVSINPPGVIWSLSTWHVEEIESTGQNRCWREWGAWSPRQADLMVQAHTCLVAGPGGSLVTSGGGAQPACNPDSPASPQGVLFSWLRPGSGLVPGGDTVFAREQKRNKPRNSGVAISPCSFTSFSLHSRRNSRQQPRILLRSLLSMGSQFCKGAAPGALIGLAGV